VECGGVNCKTDMCLYDDKLYCIYLLSMYGAPQSTKGLFSLLAAGQTLNAGSVFLERPREAIRMRGMKLAYAKHHALVWSEKVGKEIVVWTSDKERLTRLHGTLSQRRIPIDPAKLPQIEQLLIRNEYLFPLSGWGGIGGYITKFDDDDICDLILSTIYNHEQVQAAA